MQRGVLERSEMLKAYRFWALVYDFIFPRFFKTGHMAAIEQVSAKNGTHFLDVGVGTGLALPLYDDATHVTGVDLSPDMLKKARARAQKMGLNHVKELLDMDATQLAFADESFDGVVAEYMLTLIPNAEDALSEFARVCRPGGRIVLVNYFCSEAGLGSVFDKVYGALARWLGLATDFPISRVTNWLEGREDVRLVHTQNVGFLHLFTVVTMERVV